MEFLSNSQNVKSLRKLKVPLLKTFWRWLFGLNLTSFRATISLRSGKSDIHANRESNSCNCLGAFYLTCFARVSEIFTAVVSKSQRGPQVVL